MLKIQSDEPLAVAAVEAIRSGRVEALSRLLQANPGLAAARILESGKGGGSPAASRSLLHIATDWPGNFPNSAETISTLIQHGAEVNARFEGKHAETPLHWAASTDDVAALDALLDHGADIEAPGAVIGGGGPLADAVAFGQWRAARRLVEHGARTTLWQAAALGLLERIEQRFDSDASAQGSLPTPGEVTQAFWCACHGGRLEAARYLLDRGADLDWVGYDALTPLDAARRSGAEDLVAWLLSRGAKSAKKPS